MKIYEFLNLEEHQRYETIWDDGVHLEPDQLVRLFCSSQYLINCYLH